MKEKDIKRQNRLINYLHLTKFFRYDVRDKKLMEVISNKEIICQEI